MTWLEIAALVVLLLGVGAGGFLVAQRPTFWVGIGGVLLKAIIPYLVTYITRRMPPEDELRWRQCQSRGGRWNTRTRKCE